MLSEYRVFVERTDEYVVSANNVDEAIAKIDKALSWIPSHTVLTHITATKVAPE